MRVRVHQLLVALPLTLVSTLGIAVAVQSFSLESTDLLSIAPAETAQPLDAIRGSVEGVVPPPPARPVEPAAAPAIRPIIGFTVPPGGAVAVEAAPAPKAKAPAARAQRPKPAAVPRAAAPGPDCLPGDPTISGLPNPGGVPRQRSVSSGPLPQTSSGAKPLLPGALPSQTRTSAGLPTGGSTITGSPPRPSTSGPGPSTSGPGPSISRSNPSRAHSEGEPVRTPRVRGCAGADRGAPRSPAERRGPLSEPVVARDGGLETPARSGW